MAKARGIHATNLMKKRTKIIVSIIIAICLCVASCVLLFVIKSNKNTGFTPTITDLKSGKSYILNDKIKISSLTLLGNNKYPDSAVTDDNHIVYLPDKPIQKDTVIVRSKHNKDVVEEGLGTIEIGGITSTDNCMFEDSNFTYMLIFGIDDYNLCGINIGMSLEELQKSFGEDLKVATNDYGTTTASYSTTYNNCIYNLIAEIDDSGVYRIILNLNNAQIGQVSDEEFEKFLKDMYGEDAVSSKNNEHTQSETK